jgi:ADP-ribosylglycohydrolase
MRFGFNEKESPVKISWIDPVELVEHELNQLEEEGKDVSTYRKRWNEEKEGKPSLVSFARVLLEELSTLTDNLHNKAEPSTLNEIVALCPSAKRTVRNIDRDTLGDRIAGGWLGRSAGCLLGKPVEKIPRAGIREILHSNGSWPLAAYFTGVGVPRDTLEKYPWNRHFGKESLRENILCMPEDDDMNYPMLNLSVLESAGTKFSTEEIALAWMGMLPVLSTFTAERVAYLNCLHGIAPPETATTRNPYREWIGAQIRGDVFGWVSAGRPLDAAELAYRDARLSHVRNGIYAEMFVSAMIAAACVVETPREAVEAGLGCVPPGSRLADAIRFSLALPGTGVAWEGAVDRLYEKFGRYHWVHSINNTSLVVAALIYSGGDFATAICNVVMGGWDTDSNGATVGSVMGTLIGATRLPGQWISPLNNRIRSSLRNFDNSAITQLAERTLKVHDAHQK